MNCSRCGVKIKKGKERKVAEFNCHGLRDATFCDECMKWWFEKLEVERELKKR